MSGDGTLVSVNVGRPRTVPGGRRFVRSAIWKTPVEGRVAVRGVNVDGDEQADLRVHGGPDKAVYAYGMDDTRRWEAELGRPLGPGAFGENLTIEGLDVSGARPGDRWAIGTTALEVVQPRLPCAKLGFKFGDPGFVKRFARAGRPGAYLRIVEEGDLGAGDPVEVIRRAEHDVSVRFMMHALLVDHAGLRDVLDVPGLIDDWRTWATERLAGGVIAKVEPITTARSLRGPFDYLRPDGVGKGSLLVVPFGRRDVTGVVVGVADASDVPAEKLVAPRRVLEERVPPELVDLAAWMASEYCSTFARALQLVLPPAGARAKTALWAQRTAAGEAVDGGRDDVAPERARLTARQRDLLASLPRWAGPDLQSLRRLEARGLVAIAPRPQRRAPRHVPVGARGGRPALTADQRSALLSITRATPGERLLLHGVTGSGKTEVYLGAVEEVLARGQGAIVLVPEIALTPQIVARFVERFGDTVAVLHSKLSRGERYDEWQRLRRGEARVCVGPRSAVFAPIADLGLIVVDEEHDPSYKHEGDPRYDARRVAERRGATLVCGSATPRPESAHGLRRLRLPQRVDGARLPPVEVVDMLDAGSALHADTAEALHRADKAIVLLNRRGWSNFLTCRSCAHVWMCPECDVSLVLHRADELLACHHCGHRARVPQTCPSCSSVSVARHGAGTERLEHELTEAGLPVWRLDADVQRPAEVLRAFEQAPRGVLVGTQMVAKGHDFPDVTLGVVLDADATLRFPDFRAEERTFALVAQLMRPRPGSAAGRVLVQTLSTDAPSIAHAAEHDADGFLAGELARREVLRYPPFSSLIRIVTSSTERGAAHAAASAVRDRLGAGPPVLLGPAPLFRLRGRERAQLLLKARPHKRASAVAAVGAAVDAVASAKAHRAAAFSVDVDPH